MEGLKKAVAGALNKTMDDLVIPRLKENPLMGVRASCSIWLAMAIALDKVPAGEMVHVVLGTTLLTQRFTDIQLWFETLTQLMSLAYLEPEVFDTVFASVRPLLQTKFPELDLDATPWIK